MPFILLLIGCVFSSPLASSPVDLFPSVDTVESWLTAKPSERPAVGTADQLIEKLKSSYAYEDFKTNYTMVHTSRSLQPAFANYPRIIHFGLVADFLFAYSGWRDHHRYHVVEGAQYLSPSSEFLPFEAVFNPKTQTGKVIRNPLSCATCHFPDFRPNMSEYSKWSGFYGSDDDALSTSVPRDNPNLYIHTGLYEANSLNDFLAGNKRTGRYADLKFLKRIGQPDLVTEMEVFKASKNGRMNALLGNLNRSRFIERWRCLPEYPEIRYAIASALFRCEDFDKYVGGKSWSRLKNIVPLANLTEETRRFIIQGKIEELRRQQRLSGPKDIPDTYRTDRDTTLSNNSKIVGRLRFLFENLGYSTRGMSMEMGLGRYGVSDGGFGWSDVSANYLLAARRDIAWTQADLDYFKSKRSVYGMTVDESVRTEACRRLGEAHEREKQQAFALPERHCEKTLPKKRADSLSDETVMVRCMSCHTYPYEFPDLYKGKKVGPHLKLDDSAEFRKQLLADDKRLMVQLMRRITTKGPGRMPPAPHEALTFEEQKSFVSYVSSLFHNEGPPDFESLKKLIEDGE